jgi:hypothetical protein
MQLVSKDRQRRFTLEVSSKILSDGNGKPIGIHAIASLCSPTWCKEIRALTHLLERDGGRGACLAVALAAVRQKG